MSKNQFSLMKKGDIIRHFFQITDDMGRHQHRMTFILDKIQQHIQNIIPDYRVKSTGSLIHIIFRICLLPALIPMHQTVNV